MYGSSATFWREGQGRDNKTETGRDMVIGFWGGEEKEAG